MIHTQTQNRAMQNRREFLARSALTACACGMLGACSSSDGSSPTSGGETVTLEIDTSQPTYSALASNGGSIALSANDVSALTSGAKSARLLLYRSSSSEVKAFNGACPHAGGDLPTFSSGTTTCPLHGAEFDTSGAVTTHPNTGTLNQNLTAYTASVSGNTITVELT